MHPVLLELKIEDCCCILVAFMYVHTYKLMDGYMPP